MAWLAISWAKTDVADRDRSQFCHLSCGRWLLITEGRLSESYDIAKTARTWLFQSFGTVVHLVERSLKAVSAVKTI